MIHVSDKRKKKKREKEREKIRVSDVNDTKLRYLTPNLGGTTR